MNEQKIITNPQDKTQHEHREVGKVAVFNTVEMQRRKENSNSRSNIYQNMKLFLAYLENTEGRLNLVRVYLPMLNELMRLVLTYPNFKEVIEFYVENIALQLLNKHATFYVDPVLISGEAGIGKTSFCHAVSRVIRAPFDVISFSSTTAGFVLAGSSPTWADGKAGRIVEILATNKTANPFIMLDELDKAEGDGRYNPIGSLYQLLEEETAKSFVDEGLEIACDCSKIVWVATANEPDFIPAPLLSRFTIFHVKSPSDEEMRRVVNSIYSNVIKNNDWGEFFDKNISSNAVDRIIDSQISPRHIQKEIKSACAKIATNYLLSKKQNNEGKFKITEQSIKIKDQSVKSAIGFY